MENASERELTVEQRELLHRFPTLSGEELETVNSMYRHYVFYKTVRGGRELHTSCCHARAVFYPERQQLETQEHWNFKQAKHDERVTCPYCGRPAILKNIGISKGCKNLRQDEEVVFMHCVNGEVFAQAYWSTKQYGDGMYHQEPHYSVSIVYHFRPGRATMFYKSWGNWRCVEQEAPQRGRLKIVEPFTSGNFSATMRYSIIGMDCLKDSAFQYCHPETWDRMHPQTDNYHGIMKYLAACCLYPAKIEMLRKHGLRNVVSDLVYDGKKNAAAIKWDEPNPYKAFGLDKNELRAFMDLGCRDVVFIAAYKKLKKAGMQTSFQAIERVNRSIYPSLPEFVGYCIRFKRSPERFVRYLEKFTGGCHAGGYRSTGEIYRHWKDYIDAAAAIGYDLTNETVVFPKDLQQRHDEATGEQRRRIEAAQKARIRKENAAAKAKREQEEAERHKELEARDKRYRYRLGDYFIRPAGSADEVIAEGKALAHCVAGYAARHEEGKLTICVLRRVDAPDTPLVTIEMKGTDMRQAHGYRNERDKAGNKIAPPPTKQYACILDPWLAWVKAGSRRDKSGNPVMPGKKKRKSEGTAA